MSTKKDETAGGAEEKKGELPKITYETGATGGGTPPTSNSTADEFDPLDPPVVERDHVKQNMGMGGSDRPAETIPEDTIKVNPLGSEPKKEEPKKSSTSASTSSSTSSSSEKTDKPFANPELKDMSKAQKTREAEKLANGLIFHYSLYVPMLFKSWASFNERKVEQLAIEDKIDLNQVFDIGREITAKEYMVGVNAEVERAFSVSDERKESIREPLIEVLIEQGMVLTATQRLFLAIGSDMTERLMLAVKIFQQNNKILDHMVQKHAENKEARKPSPPPASAPPHSPPPSTPSPSSGGGGYGGGNSANGHHEETHRDDSVTATDESTGEKFKAEVLSSTTPDEKKSGGRPKGTGTRQSKNAISVDEVINDDDKVSLKDEIIEGRGENGDAEEN